MLQHTIFRHNWTCTCCGKSFNELPLHWNVPAPDYYDGLPEHERETRAQLAPSACVIDDQFFFVRGLIEIPLHGHSEMFSYGAWVSLSTESFDVVGKTWEDPEREQQGPFFGWLSTTLPLYPNTLGLKTMVHLRKPPTIPFIELEPTDHPLAVEQRDGITMERAVEIAQALLPPH